MISATKEERGNIAAASFVFGKRMPIRAARRSMRERHLGVQCELGECVENGPNIWEVLVGTFVVAVSTKHRSVLHATFRKFFEEDALPFLAAIVLPV